MTPTSLARVCLFVAALLSFGPAVGAAEPLRIIVFGAHPDDCEYDAGGTAALWVKAGFKVKFVAVTNGDIGHHAIGGAMLARRRAEEARKAAAILGVETEVLDNHDGELMPTLENRRTITRKIREWKADVVVSNRPNDYHPDHRYTGVLVQDAAFMVTVPGFCPDVPALRKNPVFLYTEDEFRRPNPFSPDVVVPIDAVVEKKLDAFDAIESQFYEWEPWMGDDLDQVPADKTARRRWLAEQNLPIFAKVADRFRMRLVEQLGEARGKAVRYAEAFEVCEYGTQPSRDELRRIFPFLGGD
jgi:LmbE family N-acetylglucosaminyl deacetylase